MYDIDLANGKIDDFLTDGNSNAFLSRFQKYLQLECAWPWFWSFDCVKYKRNYANQKPKHDFLLDGKSDVCHIYNNLQDINCQNMNDLDLEI